VPDYPPTDESWGRHMEEADLSKRRVTVDFVADGRDSHFVVSVDGHWGRFYLQERHKGFVLDMAMRMLKWLIHPPVVKPED